MPILGNLDHSQRGSTSYQPERDPLALPEPSKCDKQEVKEESESEDGISLQDGESARCLPIRRQSWRLTCFPLSDDHTRFESNDFPNTASTSSIPKHRTPLPGAVHTTPNKQNVLDELDKLDLLLQLERLRGNDIHDPCAFINIPVGAALRPAKTFVQQAGLIKLHSSKFERGLNAQIVSVDSSISPKKAKDKGITRLECKVCFERIKLHYAVAWSHLRRHKINTRRVPGIPYRYFNRVRSPNSPIKYRIKCEFCQETFTGSNDLDAHKISVHNSPCKRFRERAPKSSPIVILTDTAKNDSSLEAIPNSDGQASRPDLIEDTCSLSQDDAVPHDLHRNDQTPPGIDFSSRNKTDLLPPDPLPLPVRCSYCRQYVPDLLAHNAYAHTTAFKCKLCPETKLFYSAGTAKYHRRFHELPILGWQSSFDKMDTKNTKMPIKKFLCGTCGLFFKTVRYYRKCPKICLLQCSLCNLHLHHHGPTARAHLLKQHKITSMEFLRFYKSLHMSQVLVVNKKSCEPEPVNSTTCNQLDATTNFVTHSSKFCAVCKYNPQDLMEHKIFAHEMAYRCKLCNSRLHYKSSSAKRHLKSKHGLELEDWKTYFKNIHTDKIPFKISRREGKLVCDSCGLFFKDLALHVQTKHSAVQCTMCHRYLRHSWKSKHIKEHPGANETCFKLLSLSQVPPDVAPVLKDPKTKYLKVKNMGLMENGETNHHEDSIEGGPATSRKTNYFLDDDSNQEQAEGMSDKKNYELHVSAPKQSENKSKQAETKSTTELEVLIEFNLSNIVTAASECDETLNQDESSSTIDNFISHDGMSSDMDVVHDGDVMETGARSSPVMDKPAENCSNANWTSHDDNWLDIQVPHARKIIKMEVQEGPENDSSSSGESTSRTCITNVAEISNCSSENDEAAPASVHAIHVGKIPNICNENDEIDEAPSISSDWINNAGAPNNCNEYDHDRFDSRVFYDSDKIKTGDDTRVDNMKITAPKNSSVKFRPQKMHLNEKIQGDDYLSSRYFLRSARTHLKKSHRAEWSEIQLSATDVSEVPVPVKQIGKNCSFCNTHALNLYRHLKQKHLLHCTLCQANIPYIGKAARGHLTDSHGITESKFLLFFNVLDGTKDAKRIEKLRVLTNAVPVDSFMAESKSPDSPSVDLNGPTKTSWTTAEFDTGSSNSTRVISNEQAQASEEKSFTGATAKTEAPVVRTPIDDPVTTRNDMEGKCHVCNCTFSNLAQHSIDAHTNAHECKTCGKYFYSEIGAKVHLRRNHKLNKGSWTWWFKTIDTSNSPLVQMNRRRGRCGECRRVFPDIELHNQHVHACKLQCTICQMYLRPYGLQNHFSYFHKLDNPSYNAYVMEVSRENVDEAKTPPETWMKVEPESDEETIIGDYSFIGDLDENATLKLSPENCDVEEQSLQIKPDLTRPVSSPLAFPSENENADVGDMDCKHDASWSRSGTGELGNVDFNDDTVSDVAIRYNQDAQSDESKRPETDVTTVTSDQHGEISQKTQISNIKLKKCHVCGLFYRNVASHITKQHERGQNQCVLCKNYFQTRGALHKHLRVNHKIKASDRQKYINQDPPLELEKNHQVKTVSHPQNLGTQNSQTGHSQIEKGEVSYGGKTCAVCNFRVPDLPAHKKHAHTWAYRCKLCTNLVYGAIAAKAHVGKRKHQLDSETWLQNMVRVRTDKMPLPLLMRNGICNFCGLFFVNLASHRIREHPNIKCKFCSAHLRSKKSLLLSHLKNTHQIEKFSMNHFLNIEDRNAIAKLCIICNCYVRNLAFHNRLNHSTPRKRKNKLSGKFSVDELLTGHTKKEENIHGKELGQRKDHENRAKRMKNGSFCKMCGPVVPDLDHHNQFFHTTARRCRKCPAVFYDVQAAKIHLSRTHKLYHQGFDKHYKWMDTSRVPVASTRLHKKCDLCDSLVVCLTSHLKLVHNGLNNIRSSAELRRAAWASRQDLRIPHVTSKRPEHIPLMANKRKRNCLPGQNMLEIKGHCSPNGTALQDYCVICNFSFPDLENHKIHVHTSALCCRICPDKIFYEQSAAKRHRTRFHRGNGSNWLQNFTRIDTTKRPLKVKKCVKQKGLKIVQANTSNVLTNSSLLECTQNEKEPQETGSHMELDQNVIVNKRGCSMTLNPSHVTQDGAVNKSTNNGTGEAQAKLTSVSTYRCYTCPEKFTTVKQLFKHWKSCS